MKKHNGLNSAVSLTISDEEKLNEIEVMVTYGAIQKNILKENFMYFKLSSWQKTRKQWQNYKIQNVSINFLLDI